MTEEQRLDRLERIVKLMIKAGLRARHEARDRGREQDEKINILIDLQMRNDERFAKYEERFEKNEEALAALAKENEGKLAALASKTEEKFAAMAAAQEGTERQLKSLAATVERIITERRNGQP